MNRNMRVSIDRDTPIARWFVRKILEMDDLEVPPFQETSKYVLYNVGPQL